MWIVTLVTKTQTCPILLCLNRELKWFITACQSKCTCWLQERRKEMNPPSALKETPSSIMSLNCDCIDKLRRCATSLKLNSGVIYACVHPRWMWKRKASTPLRERFMHIYWFPYHHHHQQGSYVFWILSGTWNVPLTLGHNLLCGRTSTCARAQKCLLWMRQPETRISPAAKMKEIKRTPPRCCLLLT